MFKKTAMGLFYLLSSCGKFGADVIPDGDGFQNANILNGIAADFAAAKAGTINVKLIQVGDSNIEYGYNNKHAWQTILESLGYDIKGTQFSQIFNATTPFNNYRYWSNSVWAFTDWTDESSTTNGDGNSVSLHTSKAVTGAVPFYFYAFPATPAREFGTILKVLYRAQVGGGTIEMRANPTGSTPGTYGGGTVLGTIDTSDTTGAAAGLKVATFTFSSSSFGVAPTGNVEIFGFQIYGADSKGVHVIPLGHSGVGAGNFSTKSVNALWRNQLAEVGVTLAAGDKTYVFWNLGTNDFRFFTTTPSQFKTYMQTNITSTLAALPTAKIILQGPPTHNYAAWGGDNTRRLEFCTKLIELANENGCVYWDLDYTISSNYSTYTDGLHWTLEGNEALANSFITKFGL